MNSPVFQHFLHAPTLWWTPDHPWVLAFGDGHSDGSCPHCNKTLRKRAVVDTAGKLWCIACFNRRTQDRVKAPTHQKGVPKLQLSSAGRGFVVSHNSTTYTFPYEPSGIPDPLVNAFSIKDRGLYQRATSKLLRRAQLKKK